MAKPPVVHATSVTPLTLESIGLVGLSDANNPYSKQYQPWDDWAYRNLFLDERKGCPPGIDPNSWFTLEYWIDEQHCLLPILEKDRLFQEKLKAGADARAGLRPEGYSRAFACGPITGFKYADYLSAKLAQRAAYYPRIPRWVLGQAVDSNFMLTPNGDIIEVLRVAKASAAAPTQMPDLPADGQLAASQLSATVRFRRFSADGVFISESLDNPVATYMSADQERVVRTDRENGAQTLWENGRLRTVDGQGHVLHRWDFDGRPMAAADFARPVDGHFFELIRYKDISQYFWAQQSVTN